ncbi:energy transducer TonB [Novosphingobium sp. G106]|uniref:energy transducer TonB n=1 Tax=Novosphingobium sp. G106 TaxID=2849500 RepID=UPI0020C3656F|nr:energy transducer TonB [Novosphingobium sp. G106]
MAAFCIVVLLAFALVFGLRVGDIVRNPGALVSVIFDQPKPPPPPEPKPRARPAETRAPKGDPGQHNLKNQATPIVAPKVVPLIVPPPVVVATQAGIGQAAQTGASDRMGPGQGAGGYGNGGGGDGGDGDGGAVAGPRQIKGKLSFKDLPDGMLRPGSEARVGVRYVVEADGTVSQCRADEPSGIPQLDRLACRLIEERFRFRPARDRFGRPVRATIAEAHSWFMRDDGEDRDD